MSAHEYYHSSHLLLKCNRNRGDCGLNDGCQNCVLTRLESRGPDCAPWRSCVGPEFRNDVWKREAQELIDNGMRNKKQRHGLRLGGDSPPHQTTATSSASIIPESLLGMLLAPFIADRKTFNNFSMASREIYKACKRVPAPWPRRSLKVDSVVQSVAFSPSGQLLACSAKRNIRLWDRQTGHCQIIESPAKVTCVTFSPDGRYLASGHRASIHTDDDFVIMDDNGKESIVCLWDLSTLTCAHILQGHQYGSVLSIAFSPDGQTIASGGADHSICLWNVSDGACIKTLHGHSDWIYDIKFSPNGRYLASVGEDETAVWLWDLADETCTTLEGHTDCVHCIDFTLDGKYLVSGSDDETIRLWDMTDRSCYSVLEGNQCSVWTVACSPDSRTLVSGSREVDGGRVLRIWSIQDGRHTSVLRGHDDCITSVVFSPSGRTVASGAFDCVVCTWNLATENSTPQEDT